MKTFNEILMPDMRQKAIDKGIIDPIPKAWQTSIKKDKDYYISGTDSQILMKLDNYIKQNFNIIYIDTDLFANYLKAYFIKNPKQNKVKEFCSIVKDLYINQNKFFNISYEPRGVIFDNTLYITFADIIHIDLLTALIGFNIIKNNKVMRKHIYDWQSGEENENEGLPFLCVQFIEDKWGLSESYEPMDDDEFYEMSWKIIDQFKKKVPDINIENRML